MTSMRSHAIRKRGNSEKGPKSSSYTSSLRIVTIAQSDGDSGEVSRFAGIVQKPSLNSDHILTEQNNESALGSAFSRFY